MWASWLWPSTSTGSVRRVRLSSSVQRIFYRTTLYALRSQHRRAVHLSVRPCVRWSMTMHCQHWIDYKISLWDRLWVCQSVCHTKTRSTPYFDLHQNWHQGRVSGHVVTYCFFCQSNAIHGIGQILKSLECMSVCLSVRPHKPFVRDSGYNFCPIFLKFDTWVTHVKTTTKFGRQVPMVNDPLLDLQNLFLGRTSSLLLIIN